MESFPKKEREQDDERTDDVVNIEDHTDAVKQIVKQKDHSPSTPALFLEDDEPQPLIIPQDVCCNESPNHIIGVQGHVILTETG